MEEEQLYNDGQKLVEKKQQERQLRKGKKQQNLMKGTLRFLTTFAIIGLVGYALTLKGWYLPKDVFQKCAPDRIQIVNNKIAKSGKIKASIKNVPVPKSPIFLSNLSVLKKQILALSPVEDVFIRRYAFPARIQIIIKESTPIVSVSPDVNVRPVAAFTKEGRLIIGADYLPLPAEYNTLLILSYGNKGDDYKKWDLKKIKEIQDIANNVENYTGEPVEYVDMKNPDDIYVKVKTVLVRIGKNDSLLNERIKRLPSILPEAEKVKSKLNYIDIRWDNVNYLKMKE